MTEIHDLSTSAGSNTADFPEGLLASLFNDRLRELEAAMRRRWNLAEWFEFGDGDLSATYTVISATQFRVNGADVRTSYHVGRRVRAIGSLTTTIVGSITEVTLDSGNTTVTVVWDAGALATETVEIQLGIVSAVNTSIPGVAAALSGITIPIRRITVQRRTTRARVTGDEIVTVDTITYVKSGGTAVALSIEAIISYLDEAVTAAIQANVAGTIEVVIGSTVRSFLLDQDVEHVRKQASVKGVFTGLSAGAKTILIRMRRPAGDLDITYNPTPSDNAAIAVATESVVTIEEF
jgi:hypothetical protein